MEKFVLNKNKNNGKHEVHCPSLDCGHLPEKDNRIDLGYHKSLNDALKYAKDKGYNASICEHCRKLEE